MIRKIILILFVCTFTAQAQTTTPVLDDITIQMYTAIGTQISRFVRTDKTGALQLLVAGQDPTVGAPAGQIRPQRRLLGPSFTCGTTYDSTCDVVATSLNIYAAQLQDSSSVGRDVIRAVDGTAARMAIGAGTSSFDGSYASLSSVPLAFAPIAHNQAFSTITGLPTTRAGYGITDAFGIPSGTTSQYLRGDGTLAAFPVIPSAVVINRAAVTTSTAGVYTWTMPIACATGQLPIVAITPEDAGTAIVNPKVTARTNTTVTVNAQRTEPATLLGLTILSIPATAVASTLHLLAICP